MSVCMCAGDPDEWEQTVHLNMLAPMRLTRAVAPGMADKQDGIIINISSVAGINAQGGNAVYAASKFGLRGWSLSCYEALRSHKIKVGWVTAACICGGVHTRSGACCCRLSVVPSVELCYCT